MGRFVARELGVLDPIGAVRLALALAKATVCSSEGRRTDKAGPVRCGSARRLVRDACHWQDDSSSLACDVRPLRLVLGLAAG